MQNKSRTGSDNYCIFQLTCAWSNIEQQSVHVCVHDKLIRSSCKAHTTATLCSSRQGYFGLSYSRYSTDISIAAHNSKYQDEIQSSRATNIIESIVRIADRNAKQHEAHNRRSRTTVLGNMLELLLVIFQSAWLAFSYLYSATSSSDNAINCDILSLGYNMNSSLMALVCEGDHHGLKTWNGVFRPKTTTTNYQNMLSKIKYWKSKRYEILSIPRECDQTWSNWQFKYIAGFLSIESQ